MSSIVTDEQFNQFVDDATPLDPMGQIMKQMQGDNKTDRIMQIS
jgi:hypothetical protein